MHMVIDWAFRIYISIDPTVLEQSGLVNLYQNKNSKSHKNYKIAAQLSIILATIWIYLSSIPLDHPIIEFFSKVQWYLLPIWTVTLTVICLILMMNHRLVHILPLNAKPFRLSISSPGY